MRSILVVLLLTLVSLELVQCEVPCKLHVWPTWFKGTAVPDTAVSLAGPKTYSFIAKTTIDYNGPQLYLGTVVDRESPNMYIPNPRGNGESSTSRLGEILDNPEKCPIKWVLVANTAPAFAVTVEGQYIGRVMIDGIYFAGNVTFNPAPELTVADTKKVHTFTKDFEVLTSASAGLTIMIVNFKMDDIDPTNTGANAIASEEIHNNAETEIEQMFKHSKTIKEKVVNVVKNTQTWITTTVSSSGFNAILWGGSYSMTHTLKYTEETTKTWTTEKITEISVERTIRVPPNQRIQACSMVTIKDNVDLDYFADAVYTAPTLTAAEIIDIVEKDPVKPVKGLVILDGLATLVGAVEGNLKASLAMDSAFYINDLHTNPNASCSKTAETMRVNRENYVRQLKGQSD